MINVHRTYCRPDPHEIHMVAKGAWAFYPRNGPAVKSVHEVTYHVRSKLPRSYQATANRDDRCGQMVDDDDLCSKGSAPVLFPSQMQTAACHPNHGGRDHGEWSQLGEEHYKKTWKRTCLTNNSPHTSRSYYSTMQFKYLSHLATLAIVLNGVKGVSPQTTFRIANT